jgi:hypothetical protein
MMLKSLYRDTLKNNGATIDRNGDTVTKDQGYVVSHVGHEIQIPASEFTYATFVEVLFEQAQTLRSSGEFYGSFVGFWFDQESNTWYSDISQVVYDLDVAKRLGKNRKQLAIFDLESKSAISL